MPSVKVNELGIKKQRRCGVPARRCLLIYQLLEHSENHIEPEELVSGILLECGNDSLDKVINCVHVFLSFLVCRLKAWTCVSETTVFIYHGSFIYRSINKDGKILPKFHIKC